MKIKKLNVLIPALAGMLLTTGTISSVNNFEQVSEGRKIHLEKNLCDIFNFSDYGNSGIKNKGRSFVFNKKILIPNGFPYLSSPALPFLELYRSVDNPANLYFDMYLGKENDLGNTKLEEYVPYFAEIDSEGKLVFKDKVEHCKVSDFVLSNRRERYNHQIAKSFVVTSQIHSSDIEYEITGYSEDDGFDYVHISFNLKEENNDIRFSPFFESGSRNLKLIYRAYNNSGYPNYEKTIAFEENLETYIPEVLEKYLKDKKAYFVYYDDNNDYIFNLSFDDTKIPEYVGDYYDMEDLKNNFIKSNLIEVDGLPDIEENSNVKYDKIYFDKSFDIRKYLFSTIRNTNGLGIEWETNPIRFPKYILGNINEIKLYKNSNNLKTPSVLYVDFELYNIFTDEVDHKFKLYFPNTYTSENIIYSLDDKDISNEEIIEVGYSKKYEDLLKICNVNFLNYVDNLDLNVTLDGQSSLGYEKDKSLYEYVKDKTGYSELHINLEQKGIKPSDSYEFKFSEEEYLEFSYNKTFYIKWVDDISPEVTGEVLKYRTSNKDNFKFKELFKAEDEKDGDVSESIELIDEEGKYYIKAKDSSGNETKQEIVLDIDNILYENINVINDEIIEVPENILLTKNRFEKILKKIHEVDPEDVNMLEYINNSRTKGTYKVTYKVNDEEKEMNFNVVDPIEKIVEPEDVADQINEIKDNFIEKVKSFFNKLGNWFRGVFTKFKFDCFITDEDWDTRFN